MAPEGLVIHASSHGPKETVDRLLAAVANRGIPILARIDHTAAAAEAGLMLRPTVVVVFGNARAGTPLMQVAQSMGIDLPLKALVWQDDAGHTSVAYNDPAWPAGRHGADAEMGKILGTMAAALLPSCVMPLRASNQNRRLTVNFSGLDSDYSVSRISQAIAVLPVDAFIADDACPAASGSLVREQAGRSP